MLALLRTVSGRYLRLHGLRTLLVIASIALGVTTLVATRALNQSMVQAARGASTPLHGASDLLVTNGNQGVNQDVISLLRNAELPGVKAIMPLVFGRLTVPSLGNRHALLIGVEADGEAMQMLADQYGLKVPFRIPQGIPRGYTASVGSLLANDLGDQVWNFDVRAEGGLVKRVSCLGTVEAQGPAAALGGNIVVTTLANATEILGWNERANPCVTRIDLLLHPSANKEQIRLRVAEVLDGRADVRTPEYNDQTVHKVMAGLELGFQLGGLCALGVGFLLVFMVLSVSVAERRHDIGVMRSLGATRRQIAGLFLSEAALLGIIGAVLGVPLGLGLAHLFLGPFQHILSDVFVRLDSRQILIEPQTVVLSLLLGVLVSMVAAVVPAVRAACEEPADAVRRVPPHIGRWGRFLPAAFSLTLIAIGLTCFALRGELPERRYGIYGAAFFTFLGAVTASIPLAAVAAKLLQPFVRSFLGVEERLAADNLTRAPLRTGLVIAILAAFVALMMQTAGVTLSSKDAVLSWVDSSISAHLFVTANSPITASGQNLAMEQHVGTNIASLPEVARSVPVRYQQVNFRDDLVFLIALNPDFYSRELLPHPVPGLELLPLLNEPRTALVSDNFAILQKVAVGDTIKLGGPNGEVELHVKGTVLDYSWNRGTIIMSRDQYVAYFGDPLIDVFNVYVRSEEEQARLKLLAGLSVVPHASLPAALPYALLWQDPKPRSRDDVSETILRNWGAEEALVVVTRGQLRDSIEQMIQRLYGIGYIQEAVVGLVAAMGVITALLISVLQRRRELGLLRAVGASRRQVLRTVLAEALLMGVLGAVLGLAIGIPMEWYAVRVILLEEAGFNFSMSIPWRAVAIVTCLAMLTATIAGLIPALHAIRIRVAEAIAYE